MPNDPGGLVIDIILIVVRPLHMTRLAPATLFVFSTVTLAMGIVPLITWP